MPNNILYAEDLIANALITKIERQHCRTVCVTELDRFASICKTVWRDKFYLAVRPQTNEYDIKRAIQEHPEFFVPTITESSFEISLKTGKNPDDLRKEFRSYLSTDSLLVYSIAGDIFASQSAPKSENAGRTFTEQELIEAITAVIDGHAGSTKAQRDLIKATCSELHEMLLKGAQGTSL